MKTQINLLSACFLLAGVSMIPRVAHAQLVLTPPCTAASLSGPFAYRLAGSILKGKDDYRARVGILTFDGTGNLTDTFNEAVEHNGTQVQTIEAVSQGTYTISGDCKTGTLILHDGFDTPDAVHFAVKFTPTKLAIGTLLPGPPITLSTDAALSCTDSDAQKWSTIKQSFSSTYTGTMTEQ
jgi:hypothetical protein